MASSTSPCLTAIYSGVRQHSSMQSTIRSELGKEGDGEGKWERKGIKERSDLENKHRESESRKPRKRAKKERREKGSGGSHEWGKIIVSCTLRICPRLCTR